MTWTSQHKMEDRVVINVSGMTFETKAKTLSRFPDTLLGSPNRRQKYFNPAAQEYFFNRHRVVFESILFYYQSGGRLIWPEDVPGSIFTEEVEFFQLGEQALKNVAKCLYKERKRTSPQLSFQRKVWNLFEHPDTSHFARAIAILSILMILMSVTISCVETLPYFKGLRAAEDCNTITRVSLRCNESAASEFVTEDCDSKKFDNEDCSDNTLEIFMVLEIICYSWFLFEYLVRFASAPNRSRFLLSPMNFLDLLAIIPFFIILISGNRRWVSLAVLRTARLLRIFRILKLTRYSHGLKVLMFTLRASISELEMMVLFMFMIVLLSSSAVFYTDLGADGSQFNSIPDAFWWSMTTVSTVGYGDYYPVTSFGKFVGGVCAVFGVLAFSLPVMAFAINFNAYLLGEPIRRHIENKSTTRTTRASMRGQ